jgi:predicted nucleic acid-binding protein
MSDLVVFDTSIFIDYFRFGRHRDRIENVSGLVRTSSVVLAELWRGATKPVERDFLRELERNHPVLTPTERNWLDSGQVLGKIGNDRGMSGNKLRDLHFDVLIALTARSNGARVVTSNRADFELVAAYRPFRLEVWAS